MAAGPAAPVCSKRSQPKDGWYRRLPREDSDRYADSVTRASLRQIRPAHIRIPSSATPAVHRQASDLQPAGARRTVSLSQTRELYAKVKAFSTLLPQSGDFTPGVSARS